MLVLFDIDGTLIDTSGAGRRSLDAAIRQVSGQASSMLAQRLCGATDRQLIGDALRSLGCYSEPAEAETVAAYLTELKAELKRCEANYVVLDGVVELLSKLYASDNHLLGLATGNLEAGAQLKLEQGKLWGYFTFGGYGSDAEDRDALTAIGIERGQALAEVRLGRRVPKDQVFVIGDTERDVSAAKAAGVVSVGVLAGSTVPRELQASEPDLLVDDLKSPLLLAQLGL